MSSPPYLFSLLGSSKSLSAAGVVGWSQSATDEAVLNDDSLDALKKFRQLFGISLDWTKFPVVRVAECDPEHKYVKRAGCRPGDVLLALCSTVDRVTLVTQWYISGSTSPEHVIMERVSSNASKKRNRKWCPSSFCRIKTRTSTCSCRYRTCRPAKSRGCLSREARGR
ncbi:unnamed protein product [Amoebophrya sp. A120]|nr:unnamed protein product [Amoebophrya sp. A120]|eukprot:GSA120T00002688001.1